jgi:serine phosphatase RsbU (regulator of sigma subunit)
MSLLFDKESIVDVSIKSTADARPHLVSFFNAARIRELFLHFLTNVEIILSGREPVQDEMNHCKELALELGRKAVTSNIKIEDLISFAYFLRHLLWESVGESELMLSKLQKKELLNAVTRANEYLSGINFVLMQAYLHREREIVVYQQKRMNADLELARRIQQSMFPSHCQIGACSMCAEIIPSGAVGGDFYGMIPYEIPVPRADLFIGDVQGKGVASALVMMLITSTIKGTASAQKTPKQILSEVNFQFRRQMTHELDHFVSLFYLSYYPVEKKIFYVKAGHEDGVLIRRNTGEVVVLSTEGYFLGVFEDADYEEKSVVVNTGDRLYLFTDGATLLGNSEGRSFEYEDLYKVILKHNSLPIGDTLEHITRDLMNLYGREKALKDDVGFLVVEF